MWTEHLKKRMEWAVTERAWEDEVAAKTSPYSVTGPVRVRMPWASA
jgi:hypothetical protein